VTYGLLPLSIPPQEVLRARVLPPEPSLPALPKLSPALLPQLSLRWLAQSLPRALAHLSVRQLSGRRWRAVARRV
jgi:hypothetical protein